MTATDNHDELCKRLEARVVTCCVCNGSGMEYDETCVGCGGEGRQTDNFKFLHDTPEADCREAAARIRVLVGERDDFITAAIWAIKALERYDNALGLDYDEAALIAWEKLRNAVEKTDPHALEDNERTASRNAARQSAEAALAVAREALEFYADEGRWREYWYDAMDAAVDRNCGSEFGSDEGDIARQALASMKEKAGG